jgi:hypothetical protein
MDANASEKATATLGGHVSAAPANVTAYLCVGVKFDVDGSDFYVVSGAVPEMVRA